MKLSVLKSIIRECIEETRKSTKQLRKSTGNKRDSDFHTQDPLTRKYKYRVRRRVTRGDSTAHFSNDGEGRDMVRVRTNRNYSSSFKKSGVGK